MYYVNDYDSPLGKITLASTNDRLSGLWFNGQKFFADNLPKVCEKKESSIFNQTKTWLDVYFSGKNPDFTPPLYTGGVSEFRKRVWDILLGIPYGATMTYGEIAAAIASETNRPVSAQAVGGAVSHNPVSVIIPCHRVVGSNGSLTGYAGGIDKKIYLLKSEGTDVSTFTIPK